MAKAPVNQQVANEVVSESLGLSMDDLGADRDNAFEGLELDGDDDNQLDLDGDLDEQLDGQNDRQGTNDGDVFSPEPKLKVEKPERQSLKPDDLSVTHTGRDEFDIGKDKPKFDKHGNIIAPNGRVIAKAGKEARMFTTLHQTRNDLSNTVAQANTIINKQKVDLQKAVDIGLSVNAQLTALREAGTAHTRMGLNDTEHTQALELASAFKKDPVQAIKTILTRASASGIDLTTLGLQPGGFDTKALMDLVRSEIANVTKPIADRNAQETEQQRIARENQEAENNAATELDQFLTAAPEARNHLAIFKRILSDPDPRLNKMTLGEIWARIQLNLLKNPPKPEQRQDGNRQQRSQNRRSPPRVPDGRSTPPDGTEFARANDMADVSESYEDIVRNVMRAAG